jgi:hypothetical protein
MPTTQTIRDDAELGYFDLKQDSLRMVNYGGSLENIPCEQEKPVEVIAVETPVEVVEIKTEKIVVEEITEPTQAIPDPNEPTEEELLLEQIKNSKADQEKIAMIQTAYKAKQDRRKAPPKPKDYDLMIQPVALTLTDKFDYGQTYLIMTRGPDILTSSPCNEAGPLTLWHTTSAFRIPNVGVQNGNSVTFELWHTDPPSLIVI